MSDRRDGSRPRAHGERAVSDKLQHDQVALAIHENISGLLPWGSVISVQGPWGRGKTDVVTRVFDLFDADAKAGTGPRPIWINPWEYGLPNLIQPIVVALMDRMRGGQKDLRDRVRKAATTLLLAGNEMLCKAISVYVPFGDIATAAQPQVAQLINNVMAGGNQQVPDADADPVHEMADRFYDIVNLFLEHEHLDQNTSRPLLICIDDLDRCLPDHQIAMLEAIYFLTSAQARCSFVVALDPVLVQEAAATHYRTDGFDSNQYLDKLFQLRINLTALQPGAIGDLVDGELAATPDPALRGYGTGTVESVLREGLGADPAAVKQAFANVFFAPELTNPRLVHRAFARLKLAAAASIRQANRELSEQKDLESIVAWCAVAERWPQLRQLLQASPDKLWGANLNAVCQFYDIWDYSQAGTDERAQAKALAAGASVTSRLPGRLRQPDLGGFIGKMIMADLGVLPDLRRIDDIFVTFGL